MNLDKDKLKKLGIGALIAAAGAFLAYVAHWVSGADLGIYGPALGAIISVVINLLRKLSEQYIDDSTEGVK